MTRRAQLAILLAVLILLAIFALRPDPTKSDQPVTASPIPSSAFVAIRTPLDPAIAQQAERRVSRIGHAEAPGAEPGRGANGGVPQPRTLTPAAAPPSATVSPSASQRKATPVRVPTASMTGPTNLGGIGSRLVGAASWFASPIGVSAAGPALRAALGPSWRGTRVRVTGPAGSAWTVLGDWMRADRLIDLDVSIFPAVCGPLSLGLCRAEVTW